MCVAVIIVITSCHTYSVTFELKSSVIFLAKFLYSFSFPMMVGVLALPSWSLILFFVPFFRFNSVWQEKKSKSKRLIFSLKYSNQNDEWHWEFHLGCHIHTYNISNEETTTVPFAIQNCLVSIFSFFFIYEPVKRFFSSFFPLIIECVVHFGMCDIIMQYRWMIHATWIIFCLQWPESSLNTYIIL